MGGGGGHLHVTAILDDSPWVFTVVSLRFVKVAKQKVSYNDSDLKNSEKNA